MYLFFINRWIVILFELDLKKFFFLLSFLFYKNKSKLS